MQRLIAKVWFRIWGTVRASRLESDFEEEVHTHISMLIEDNLKRGMSPGEARRNALVRFGGVTQLKEMQREMRALPYVHSIVQDISYAARSFRKHPGLRVGLHGHACDRHRAECHGSNPL